MTDTPDPDDDMLAAEYALRLLDAQDAADAEARVRTDPAFRRAVEAWEARLADLADDVAPVLPNASNKRALMARLFPQQPRRSVWSIVRLWQGLSLASLLLAALLGWQLMMPSDPQPGPIYTAEIATQNGDFRVVAMVDKRVNEITLTRTSGAAPAGRILQVWAHGEGAPAISVGLWPEGDTVRLPLPDIIAAVEGTLTLGVSEEPPGGSTTGSPSGRVFGTVDIAGVSG